MEAVLVHAGNPENGPGAFHRNVVMRGVDLNLLIGTTFSLRVIRIQGVEERRPCCWMDQGCGTGGSKR